MKKSILFLISLILLCIPCFAKDISARDIKKDYDIINSEYAQVINFVEFSLPKTKAQEKIYKDYFSNLKIIINAKRQIAKLEETKLLCDSLNRVITEYNNGKLNNETKKACVEQYKAMLNKDGLIDEVFNLIQNDYQIENVKDDKPDEIIKDDKKDGNKDDEKLKEEKETERLKKDLEDAKRKKIEADKAYEEQQERRRKEIEEWDRNHR